VTYEELVSSMEDAAEKKNREILDRAKLEAAETLKDAEEKAREIKERNLQNSRRATEVERNRLTFVTHEEVKSRISGVKKELYEKAFSMAGDRLQNIRESESYPVFFRRLLSEAVPQVGTEGLVLHIDARDLELCTKLADELTIDGTISTDIITAGGLNVSSDNGTVVALNNIESRLEKAKEQYKLEIFTEITGG